MKRMMKLLQGAVQLTHTHWRIDTVMFPYACYRNEQFPTVPRKNTALSTASVELWIRPGWEWLFSECQSTKQTSTDAGTHWFEWLPALLNRDDGTRFGWYRVYDINKSDSNLQYTDLECDDRWSLASKTHWFIRQLALLSWDVWTVFGWWSFYNNNKSDSTLQYSELKRDDRLLLACWNVGTLWLISGL